MVRKAFFLSAILFGFLDFTESSITVQGGKCPQAEYPYFNEQCVNGSGGQNPCKDIRECDFADAIMALGGWPTVCGWVENEVDDDDESIEWPKVCCGMPQTLGEPLKKELVKKMTRKPSSTPVTKEQFTDTVGYRSGNTAQCFLPLVPPPDTSVTPEDGVRFGNTPYSRQEFSKDRQFLVGIMYDSMFSMEFKTIGDSGVMFYVSSSIEKGYNRDFIGLFMEDGKIVYVFNCGMGSAVITSQNTYNDGKWHRVLILRHEQDGQLVIDDQEEVTGRSKGIATRIDDLESPLYVGGVSEEVATRARITLHGLRSSFPGCIRNVEAQNERLTQDMLSTEVSVTPCSSKVEDGTFFSADGGYLVLYEKYRVGQRMSMSMEIKPRNLSGVLMAIHGKEDYLVLQLIDGRVEFTVDSGAGPVTTTYTPADKHELCDGQFHMIEVESKSNHSIVLSVDSVSSEKRLNVTGNSAIDTFDPLYIGGLPESSWSKGGVLTTDPFVGCMRDLVLDRESASLSKSSRLVGHVTLNTCPTT